MQKYQYRGLDRQGRQLQGQIVAEDRAEAMEQLKLSGCQATMIKERRYSVRLPGGQYLTMKDLAPFCQQLGLLLESGISLVRGLQLVSDDLSSPKMRQWVRRLQEAITAGQPLAKAVATSGYRVPSMLGELIVVGERQGSLSDSLKQAADYFDQQRKWKNELLTALLYPALVMVVIVLAIGAMMIFVVPALVQTYQSLNAPIPILTRVVISLSQFVQQYGGWLLAGVVLLIVALVLAGQLAKEQQRMRQLVVWLVKHLPQVYKMVKEQYYTQFAQMLGRLLEGGVLLMDGLQIVLDNYRGVLFADELQLLHDHALHGKSFAESLTLCSFVPQSALQMIHIGEESGQLEVMLLHSSAYYSEQTNQRLQRLTKVIEPMLIILLGLLILLVASSLFLPILSSYRYIG